MRVHPSPPRTPDGWARPGRAQVIKRYIMHSKKTAFIVEHDFIMAAYLADRVIVYEGTPSKEAVARCPQSLLTGDWAAASPWMFHPPPGQRAHTLVCPCMHACRAVKMTALAHHDRHLHLVFPPSGCSVSGRCEEDTVQHCAPAMSCRDE